MAEKGSSFNKLLILIILAGAGYYYYDNHIKVQPTIIEADNDPIIENGDSPYLTYFKNGNFKKAAELLAKKEELTNHEKHDLGACYIELKKFDKAEEILEALWGNKEVNQGLRFQAKIEIVLMYVGREEYKKGMVVFKEYIEALDPKELPQIELTLGDKLWDKFGNKVNQYWWEIHYAYGLAYNGMMEENPRYQEIENRLNKLNKYLYFQNSYVSNMNHHIVVTGDLLVKLAKKYNITQNLIQLANGMKDSTTIRPGQKLKIVNGTTTVHISKDQHSLVLFLDGLYLKRYKVGLGKENKTPVGEFKIAGNSKRYKPMWTDPSNGKEYIYADGGTNGNPLGTHWIPFAESNGIGIHGTWDPASIGKNKSNGCIRMLNTEVKEVFAFLTSKSSVEIE
ncbi:MAG: hypothetical protein COA79_10000 [Planctomycetota bacterium]|nr:MAG: hypothetical protein COA79_10000 [Planctomycetota bacterium]